MLLRPDDGDTLYDECLLEVGESTQQFIVGSLEWREELPHSVQVTPGGV